MTPGRLRILHAPVEVAGQAALSAHGLRELGVESRCFARPHPFGYSIGPDIDPGQGRVRWLMAAVGAAHWSDVVHFYFGATFLPRFAKALDAGLLRRRGRRVVIEFMGSDVRMPSLEAARNPYYVPLEGEDDRQAADMMDALSRVTDGHAILCDPGLRIFLEGRFEHIHHVPLRVEVDRFMPRPPDPGAKTPVIVHAPSHFAGKGTRHVRAAVQTLRSQGADFEYVELSSRNHADVAAALERADLVVDQLCSGSHGVFAVEAMSAAKPVVCYIHQEVQPLYPAGLPIIDATPMTIAKVLADWLEKPAERHARGLASRAYAESVHDVRTVARRLLDVYAQLPR